MNAARRLSTVDQCIFQVNEQVAQQPTSMRQNGNIQVQDPSVSPTFALSRPAANPDVPPTLRRNLFGSHLSRRPAGMIHDASTEGMPDPFTSLSASNQHSQPNGTSAPPPPPQHHNHRAANMNSQHPSIYEPRASPTRSHSPTKAQAYSSTNQSIIALDPTTGRPQLPVMPQLPPRLHEDSEEEAEEGEGEPDEEEGEDHPNDESMSWRHVRENQVQHELDLHSSSIIALHSQPSRLHDLIDTSAAGADYRDYEKIESILSEMQSQQKARARTAITAESSSNTPSDAAISGRTRGKARATTRSQAALVEQQRANQQPRIGGVGATLKPEDKDELLSLIMTGLRKQVQIAEEDAWMFGDEQTAANGVSVSGSYNLGRGDESDF